MRIYKYLFILTLGVLPLASCQKWLDVKPKNQVEASDLLSTSEGYRSALAGVYYKLSQNSLYGVELGFGMMDVLAQHWKMINTTHNYYEASRYNYKHANVSGKINTIWKELYVVVASANLILQSLEKSSPSDISSYNLIKGEALGLRAFAHMELLKLFGPVIKNGGMDKPAIAYRTRFDHLALKFNTTREVLKMIGDDLLQAKTLLADDPIKSLGRTGNGNADGSFNYDAILDRRGSRMNYYAVLGLLARNEQLKQDPDAAYKYAMELINEVDQTGAIRFTEKNEILTPSIDVFRDLKFSPEIIFSLYVNDHFATAEPVMGYKGVSADSRSAFLPDFPLLRDYVYGKSPDGSGDDYRLKFWFPTSATVPVFLKFIQPQLVTGLGYGYDPEVALIRLPEIYYIAAESQIGKNNQLALDLLNKVRLSRGLTQALTLSNVTKDEDLLAFLIREQRKEFVGEGQLFMLHKRLFQDLDVSSTVKIKANETMFVFPIPEEEYEFSPNSK